MCTGIILKIFSPLLGLMTGKFCPTLNVTERFTPLNILNLLFCFTLGEYCKSVIILLSSRKRCIVIYHIISQTTKKHTLCETLILNYPQINIYENMWSNLISRKKFCIPSKIINLSEIGI